MEYLTTETFKEKVFNFESESEFKVTKPTIIDFYADWCGPCKTIAPILEDLSKEFEGKVDIYKVNVDENHELAGAFNIRSIPALLFVPLEGKAQMIAGALPKTSFKKAIKDIFHIE